MKNPVKIEILGRAYRLTSDADEKYVQRLALYINDKIEGVLKHARQKTDLDVIVLAILNISDEFFKFKDDQESFQKLIDDKSAKLIKLIDTQG